METVNQEQEPRTFTQEEVDRIIGERLKRDRADRADYEELKAKAAKLDEIEEANKTEIQKATERAEALQKELDAMKNAETIRGIREKVAEETGVPVRLLTAETAEACAEQASEILKFKDERKYPTVPDGGEARVTQQRSTRDSFADWFNSH